MRSVRCRFVIIGSGGSSSLPNLRHVLQREAQCSVCLEASENLQSKNRRGNPCMLITVRGEERGSEQHLLVDCGKTFEEAVRRHFGELNIKGVNAVLLTHGHADAILGLDSLREVQLAREPASQWVLKAKTPIFASRDTVREARQKAKEIQYRASYIITISFIIIIVTYTNIYLIYCKMRVKVLKSLHPLRCGATSTICCPKGAATEACGAARAPPGSSPAWRLAASASSKASKRCQAWTTRSREDIHTK